MGVVVSASISVAVTSARRGAAPPNLPGKNQRRGISGAGQLDPHSVGAFRIGTRSILPSKSAAYFQQADAKDDDIVGHRRIAR